MLYNQYGCQDQQQPEAKKTSNSGAPSQIIRLRALWQVLFHQKHTWYSREALSRHFQMWLSKTFLRSKKIYLEKVIFLLQVAILCSKCHPWVTCLLKWHNPTFLKCISFPTFRFLTYFDEHYSRNASGTINQISMFLFIVQLHISDNQLQSNLLQ